MQLGQAMGGMIGAAKNRLPASTANVASTPRTLSFGQLGQNYPGFQQTPVDYNAKDPQKTLASIVKREQERFQFFYRPAQQQLIGSLQDTSIIDDARKDLSTAFSGQQARTERELSRFGLQADPAAAAQGERRGALGQTLHHDSTMNDARLEQKERNDGLRRQLIDAGRGFSDMSQNALGEAATAQSQRNANNTAAKSAQKQQNMSMAATAAMMAIMLV